VNKVKGTSCMFCGKHLTIIRGALFCNDINCLHFKLIQTQLEETKV